MTPFQPIRKLAELQYKKDDVLVVFGEVFDRGYVNGIIEEAEAIGMQIIYSTVGRRDSSQQLRALTTEELGQKKGPLINIPLEAGFDLEPSKQGRSPVDQMSDIGLNDWATAQLHWPEINESLIQGRERFKNSVKKYVAELNKILPKNKNILFVHIMAGGIPRSKIILSLSNRIFKGSGPRFLSSESFWKTDLGKLCDLSFKEVTAYTFKVLIDETQDLRNQFELAQQRVSYVAYGYHGNEALIQNEYKWFSYSPYLQGWAKLELENIATEAYQKKINALVMNVPEILTNSSSVFLGVEIPLYALLSAIKMTNPTQAKNLITLCEARLKEGYTFNDVEKTTQEYLTHPDIVRSCDFKTWPQHNSDKQMAVMKETSQKIIDMHKDSKSLMTLELSEIVFKSCGKAMLREAYSPRASVLWLGHDMVSSTLDF